VRERKGNGFRIAGRAAIPKPPCGASSTRAIPIEPRDHRRRTNQAQYSSASSGAPRSSASGSSMCRRIWRRRHVDPRARRVWRALAHHRHTGRGEGITDHPHAAFSTRARRDEGEVPLLACVARELLAQTERTAGSIPRMRTTAVPRRSYLINGVKRFITAPATPISCSSWSRPPRKGFARAFPASSSNMDAPGSSSGPATNHDGRQPWGNRARECARGRRGRVGAEGEGMRFGQQWLNIGRSSTVPRSRRRRAMHRDGNLLCKTAFDFRQPARRAPGGAVDAGRHVSSNCRPRDSSSTEPGRLDQGEEAREDATVAKYYADEWRLSRRPVMQTTAALRSHRSSDREVWRQPAQLSHHRRRERVMKMSSPATCSRLRLRTLLKVCRAANAVYSLAPRAGKGWGEG